MALTKYQRAQRVLADYVERTRKKFIWTADLKRLIAREIGTDERRSLFPTLNMMREFGLIKEVSVNKWEINIPAKW